MAERMFRILSLVFLTIGFVIAFAGTDQAAGTDNKTADAQSTFQKFIADIHEAEDANRINMSGNINSQSFVILDKTNVTTNK